MFFSSCLQRSETCFVHQNSSLEFKSGKAFVTFALRTSVRAAIAILCYGQWSVDKPDLILKKNDEDQVHDGDNMVTICKINDHPKSK